MICNTVFYMYSNLHYIFLYTVSKLLYAWSKVKGVRDGTHGGTGREKRKCVGFGDWESKDGKREERNWESGWKGGHCGGKSFYFVPIPSGSLHL